MCSLGLDYTALFASSWDIHATLGKLMTCRVVYTCTSHKIVTVLTCIACPTQIIMTTTYEHTTLGQSAFSRSSFEPKKIACDSSFRKVVATQATHNEFGRRPWHSRTRYAKHHALNPTRYSNRPAKTPNTLIIQPPRPTTRPPCSKSSDHQPVPPDSSHPQLRFLPPHSYSHHSRTA